MKKLELKHLAPYLPFKLRVLHGDRSKLMNTGQVSSVHWIGIGSVIKWQDSKAGCKPIFRPLSDLTKEIEVNGEKFVPVDYWDDELRGNDYFHELENMTEHDYFDGYLPYHVIEKLFEWHFDVFGLIKQDLAININEL